MALILAAVALAFGGLYIAVASEERRLETVAKTFSAVRGQQHEPLAGPTESADGPNQFAAFKGVADVEDRVNTGVSGDNHIVGYAFARKIVRGTLSGREMQRRDPCGEHAIQLLWKRLEEVPRAQACFYVRYRHTAVECSERTAERSGGVTLHHGKIRPHLFEDPL